MAFHALVGSMTLSTHACRKLFLNLSKTNSTLDTDALEAAAAVWSSLESQMQHGARTLLRVARRQPLLWSFQSYATSFKCRAQFQHSFLKSTFLRRGNHLEEFLSERGLVKTMPILGSATPSMAMLVGLLRPLRDGKSCDHHFVSACEFHQKL